MLMLGYLLPNIGISLLLLLLGAVVISKNPNAKLNRLFLLFVVSTSTWIIANYLSNQPQLGKPFGLVANHLVLFFSALALFSLLSFIAELSQRRFSKLWSKGLATFNIGVATIALTPYVIKDFSYQNSATAIEFGPLGPLYFLMIGIDTLLIIYLLATGLHNSKGDDRLRLTIIAASLVAMLTIVIFANAVLPLITGSFETTNLGPLSTIILAAGIAYAIVKHHLFDIRPVIARSIAYVLSLSVIALFYLIIVFTVANSIFENTNTTSAQQVFYLIAAFVTALLFPPLKHRFDRLTNKIFYRDAYDPQLLLDELNSVLVKVFELKDLLQTSGNIISKHLKADFCSFILHSSTNNQLRSFGKRIELSDEDFNIIEKSLPMSRTKVLSISDLSLREHSLNRVMENNSIMAISNLSTRGGRIGYLLLGIKKSGNIYTKNDLQVVDIISEELAIAVQNALRFEEIQAFNVTLQQKIDDATKQLRQANTRLKELDEAKDEFVSMASHQLRTPLTVIKGYLSMLLEGDMGKVTKQQKEIIQTAYDGAERMVFLIGDLLNVSRLQTGKFQIENQPSDLAEVINHEVNHLQEAAANHQLKLTFDKPKSFPKLLIDETKIRQVIMNFIDNAIYYTPAGGSISVKLEDKEHNIEFTVNDTGLGVPKSEQHHLFNKFYRAGNARKMRPDGTGLGLYMAKKIVVAQGGAIIFRSEEGKGSTFGFSLPKKAIATK